MIVNKRGFGGGRPAKPRGFTLIEVLVALAILAMAAVPLFQVFTTGLRSIDVSDRASRALAIAESALASPDAEGGWRSGTRSGREGDGFQWDIVVVPASVERPRNAEGHLYAVTARVRWQAGTGERAVELQTLRFYVEPAK